MVPATRSAKLSGPDDALSRRTLRRPSGSASGRRCEDKVSSVAVT